MDWVELGACMNWCLAAEQREADVGMELIQGDLEHLVHDDAELLDCLDECGLVSWHAEPVAPRTPPPVRTRPEPSTPPRPASGCHCRKSRCLKLYCVCYAAGTACTAGCRCQDCGNLTATNVARAKPQHCACTRNACRTKYCVCVAAGRACGPLCRCTGCDNHAQCAKRRSDVQ